MEMDKDTLQNIAAMEGMLYGQRLVLAMLIHAARTATPFDLVYREINSEYQPFVEGVKTLFPDQRMFFWTGMRAGIDSTIGMAGAIAEVMLEKGHWSGHWTSNA